MNQDSLTPTEVENSRKEITPDGMASSGLLPAEFMVVRGYSLGQWSAAPRLWSSSGQWPVRNWAAEQEVSGGRVSKASSVFIATLCYWHYHLSSAFCHISSGIINIITWIILKPSPPPPWSVEKLSSQDWSLVPKWLGTTALGSVWLLQGPDCWIKWR